MPKTKPSKSKKSTNVGTSDSGSHDVTTNYDMIEQMETLG